MPEKLFEETYLCIRCTLIKLRDEFYKNATTTTGLSFYCRVCTNKMRASIKYKAATLRYSRSEKRKAAMKRYSLSERAKEIASSPKKRQYERNYRHSFIGRFFYSRTLAQKRGLQFTLLVDEYRNIIEKPCFYCCTVTFGIESGCGLDRIDNSKGYVPDNILPCCGDCNKHRNVTWTVEEAKVAIHAVIQLRKETLCVK